MKKLKKFLYSAYLLETHSKKKENLPDEKFEDFLKSFDFPESDIEKFIKNDF